MNRMIQIWKEAIRLEKEQPKTDRKDFEVDFLPAAVEVLEKPISPVGRMVALSLCAIFVIAIAISIFGRMDVQSVAMGRMIPLGHIKVVESLEMAKVQKILVEDGQRVEKGEPLILLNPTESESDLEQVQRDLIQNAMVAVRSEMVLDAVKESIPVTGSLAETLKKVYPDLPMAASRDEVALQQSIVTRHIDNYSARTEEFEEQIASSNAQIASSRARIRRLETLFPIYKEEEAANRELMEKKLIDRVEWLQSKEKLVNASEQLSVEESTIVGHEAEIRALAKRKTSFVETFTTDRLNEMADARAKVVQLELAIIKAEDRKKNLTLVSPVTGTVQQMQVHTEGEVVQPAEPLLTVVPEDIVLEVEAQVENKDIGFIEEGQRVEVKVDSFPYTKYGMLEGTVRHISLDAVERQDGQVLFPVKITIDRQHMMVKDRQVALTPDMSVVAEIKTGNRRVIEFFITPFLKYRSESMNER